MGASKLFWALPDYISIPESIDRYGNLALSAPDFAEPYSSGYIVKISGEGKVAKWFDLPVLPETGVVRPIIRGVFFHEFLIEVYN
jgi:hypothetical protein